MKGKYGCFMIMIECETGGKIGLFNDYDRI